MIVHEKFRKNISNCMQLLLYAKYTIYFKQPNLVRRVKSCLIAHTSYLILCSSLNGKSLENLSPEESIRQ